MCFGTTSFPVMRILATKRSSSLAIGLVVLVIMLQAAMRTVMMQGLHSAAMRRAEGVPAGRLANPALAVEPHRNRCSAATGEVEDGVAASRDVSWSHSRQPVV